MKGLHSYFTTNTEIESLKTDNPLIKQGISSGYDQINNEIFMTFHKNEGSFTISYNELRNQFISFYDYLPSMYISKGKYFITTNPNLKSIYRQYDGQYNNFYGINYPSYVILNVNPGWYLTIFLVLKKRLELSGVVSIPVVWLTALIRLLFGKTVATGTVASVASILPPNAK